MSLLASDHRLIIPDVPGLGESYPLARLDDADFAVWFTEVLALCGEPPALVAHSLMGSMAARFAAAHGGLEHLVIYGAPGIGAYRMPLRLRVTAILFSLRPSERNAERFDRLAITAYDELRARRPDWLAAFSSYSRSRASVGHVKRTMRQLIGIGTRRIPDASLLEIPCPVSLVWGSEDRFVSVRLAESASKRLGWPVHIIEGAGHAAHIEQPEAFVDALNRALGSLPQPPQAVARNHVLTSRRLS
jgi:2-hydroxymuconate-semialdehyde hydrolase